VIIIYQQYLVMIRYCKNLQQQH